MKVIWLTGILLSSTMAGAMAQTASQDTDSLLPAPTSYIVTSRNANSSVWERTTYERGPSGETVPHMHRYVEMATGMHYLKDGEWLDSEETIQIQPQGGAAATQGQHQVYFPYDIYDGAIEIVTANGEHLKNRPLEIAYYDGTNSVMIAELKHSVGQILPSGNQVIYTNAFTDFAADLVCTYRKSGFESDLVFRERPPAPEAFGMSSLSTRLELFTEFFDTPAPEQIKSNLVAYPVKNSASSSRAIAAVPMTLADSILQFGTMTMVRGKAFSINSDLSDLDRAHVPVSKTWTQIQGRAFLIEEVPVQTMNPELESLPLATATASSATPDAALHQLSTSRLLPPVHYAQSVKKGLQLAKANLDRQSGVVLDYNIVSPTNNFTFQGDTTYVINGYVWLGGTTTVEGGTVVKFVSSTNSVIDLLGGDVICNTGPYKPAIFTSSDDNSVGETYSGSSGSPTVGSGSYFEPDGADSFDFHNLRFLYAGTAIDFFSGTSVISDCQFIDCTIPVNAWLDTSLYNDLFAGCSNAIVSQQNITVDAEQLTADTVNFVNWLGTPGSISLTNCIIKGTLGTSGISATNSVLVTTSSDIFQSIAAGNYYLTNDSPYRNAGTTNINPWLLADIAQSTTYPPLLFTNIIVSANTTLSPQAQRDTDVPDLGYHYAPIDYLVNHFWITNATLTVTNGTVIAGENDQDVLVTDGSSIVSIGTPLRPNWFTLYSAVQEQPIYLGAGSTDVVNPWHATNAPSGQFRFTKFSCPTGPGAGGYQLYDAQINWAYSNLLVEDCEFWGGRNDFSGYYSTAAVLKNNLFARSPISASAVAVTNNALSVSNNLFFYETLAFVPRGNSNSWYFFNNAFDHTTNSFGFGPPQMINGYNAYIGNTNVSNRVPPIGSSDVLATSFSYQTGPLGYFYQPTNSVLANTGSVTADLNGLYHYTTTTNEVKETNSIVDIGYHYVALDANGYPIDTDGDGLPDYLEDANGNGAVDSGETDWTNALDLGLKVIITEPKDNSIIP